MRAVNQGLVLVRPASRATDTCCSKISSPVHSSDNQMMGPEFDQMVFTVEIAFWRIALVRFP